MRLSHAHCATLRAKGIDAILFCTCGEFQHSGISFFWAIFIACLLVMGCSVISYFGMSDRVHNGQDCGYGVWLSASQYSCGFCVQSSSSSSYQRWMPVSRWSERCWHERSNELKRMFKAERNIWIAAFALTLYIAVHRLRHHIKHHLRLLKLLDDSVR